MNCESLLNPESDFTMNDRCCLKIVRSTRARISRLESAGRACGRAFVVIGLLATFAALAKARATTSLEGFDYPSGENVAGQNGGSGWAGAWGSKSGNGTIVAESGSLTYPGIVSTGEKMRFTGVAATGSTTVSYRDLETALDNGTYYIRFLAQNLNEGRRHFGLGLFGSAERALLGQGSTYGSWTLNHVNGITNASYTNMLVSAVDSSDVALLVLKLEILEGPERVTFWVNPDLSKPENVATAVGGTSYLTDNDYVQITRLRIGGGGYSATAGGNPTDHFMDEIGISPGSPFAPPSITCTITGGNVALAWPAEYLGWTLQTQTDPAGVGNSTTWDDVPDSNSVTSTNLPINSASSAVFFRLRSP
jgi:hypothetical protein